MSCTAAMSAEAGTAAATPMVTLRVELPEGDRTITCESGDILRDVLLAEKVRVCMQGWQTSWRSYLDTVDWLSATPLSAPVQLVEIMHAR